MLMMGVSQAKYVTSKYAMDYLRRGMACIPVPRGSKNPNFEDWQKLRLTVEEVPRYFGDEEMNVGISRPVELFGHFLARPCVVVPAFPVDFVLTDPPSFLAAISRAFALAPSASSHEQPPLVVNGLSIAMGERDRNLNEPVFYPQIEGKIGVDPRGLEPLTSAMRGRRSPD